MIKRFIFRYWWFLVLLTVAGYYFAKNRADEIRKSQDKGFSVSNIERIQSIKLKQNNNSIIVERGDDGWLVNNSFFASNDAVDALLRVITRIRSSSPIPLTVKDSLMRQIQSHGVNVTISSVSRVLKDYHIHYTSTMNLGSVGLLKDADNAYRLNLPSYEGDISSLLKLNPAYWQTNKLAIPSITETKYLEVEVPTNPENSFRLDFSEKSEPRLFAITRGVVTREYDSQKMSSFLDGLSNLTYNDIATDLTEQERKEVLGLQPDFIFNFKLTNNRTYELNVFPVPVDEYVDEFGRTMQHDPDRLYITQSNDNNIYIVKYIDAHSALREISYFKPKFN
ncbi:MAG: hypothetical protein ACLFNU_01285 [Bacteroidales bacterium]